MQGSGCFCGSPRCCRGRATAELGWRCQDQDMDCCATIPEPGTQRGQGRIRRTSQHQSHLQPKLSSGSLQCCCQPVADQRLAGCSSAASSFHIVSVSARTAVLGTQWRAGHAVVVLRKSTRWRGHRHWWPGTGWRRPCTRTCLTSLDAHAQRSPPSADAGGSFTRASWSIDRGHAHTGAASKTIQNAAWCNGLRAPTVHCTIGVYSSTRVYSE